MSSARAMGCNRIGHSPRLTAIFFALGLSLLLTSCNKSNAPQQTAQTGRQAPAEERVEKNPDRNAYFGEEHIHTSWSMDAWLMGNRITGPEDALKYAQGQSIKHPMGYDIKIETPMDFMGVTDHSEYVGITAAANTPGSAVSKLPEAQPLILKDPNDQAEIQRAFTYLVNLNSGPPVKAFMSPEVAGSIWKKNVDIAEANNHPGKFTAFCSYEWTSMPNYRNLHRNIFFRDCTHVPPMPFSSLDDNHPEALWNWMDTQRKQGNTLLAISHNANLSDGWMYPTDLDSYGRPIDAAWAASRDRNERLVEIKQIKGASETHPLLSPNDEFANYELFQGGLLGQKADGGRIDHIQGSFARQAYKDGITLQDVRGYNPYKFGMAGGSDSHNTGSPYRQDNFFGGHGQIDGTLDRRFAGVLAFGTLDVRYENPGGLTGVWAEENTRESIFDAMYRKETFGVSGPHIKVRFFGGWGYNKNIFDAKDWVHQSYTNGVPMGGDLPAIPQGKGTTPIFVIWAVKDPSSANLDRIQVIKGWTQNGQSFEKIYDVVWSGDRKPDKWTGRVPAIKSTVDIEKATYTNDVGSTELKTVWSDPDFNPSLHAFYYVRVLEIPTPRWTLIQAVKNGLTPPDVVTLTGQERAWSSPIWYTPSTDARKGAPAGMSIADLKAKGANALGDAQLKALIVGKAFWVRNNVTGEQFSVSYTPDGDSNVWHIGESSTLPSYVGSSFRNGYQGITTPYKIEGGKVITKVQQDAYAVTIYKLGDTYYGARSNEFGYANYEMIPSPQYVVNPVTVLMNQFAVELGLTEPQRQQIFPILKAEVPKLTALKKDKTLKPEQKLEQLKQISDEVDSKVTPLLDQEQQKKFQQIREQHRRELIEKMADHVIDTAEGKMRREM